MKLQKTVLVILFLLVMGGILIGLPSVVADNTNDISCNHYYDNYNWYNYYWDYFNNYWNYYWNNYWYNYWYDYWCY